MTHPGYHIHWVPVMLLLALAVTPFLANLSGHICARQYDARHRYWHEHRTIAARIHGDEVGQKLISF